MYNEKEAPLGIYDSGLGGLTVWRTIKAALPHEHVIYYGDTAHLPYGGRPARDILRFSRDIVQFLASLGSKMVIAACNTSSALALPHLQEETSIPLIGMVEPSIKEAIRNSRNQRIGLMATEGTVRSAAHARLLQKLAPDYTLVSQACPSLVPLIEAGYRSGPVLASAIANCIQPLLVAGVDCIILGCTHYPLVIEAIQAEAGSVQLIDPAQAVAEQVAGELRRLELLNPGSHNEDRVFVSGTPQLFAAAAASLGFNLSSPVCRAELVALHS